MRKEEQKKSKRRERGQAMVEVTLLCPWIFFLFMGIYDFGFFAYSAICTQNAARAAALAAAQTATAVVTPCNAALGELRMLINVGSSPSLTCNALPVVVTVTTLTNATSPACADCALNANATSKQASVQYQTVPMFLIPGVMNGQMTLTRIAEIRVIAQ
jgi:Flp pilus assembly protein TadG